MIPTPPQKIKATPTFTVDFHKIAVHLGVSVTDPRFMGIQHYTRLPLVEYDLLGHRNEVEKSIQSSNLKKAWMSELKQEIHLAVERCLVAIKDLTNRLKQGGMHPALGLDASIFNLDVIYFCVGWCSLVLPQESYSVVATPDNWY